MQEPDARPTEDTVETEDDVNLQTAPEVEDTEDETGDTETPAEEIAETEETVETQERTLEDAEYELKIEKKRTAYQQRQLDKEKKTEPATAQPADEDQELMGFTEPEPNENEERFAGDYSDWVKAHNKWGARLAAHITTVNATRAALKKQLDPGLAKYDDFAEVALEKEMPLHLQEAIFQTDIAADVAYYIGKTPGELSRLSSLTPVAAGMEVARIQVQLKTGVPMKHTTKSPGKTSPTGGKTTLSVDLDSGKLPTADYIAQKNAAEGIA